VWSRELPQWGFDQLQNAQIQILSRYYKSPYRDPFRYCADRVVVILGSNLAVARCKAILGMTGEVPGLAVIPPRHDLGTVETRTPALAKSPTGRSSTGSAHARRLTPRLEPMLVRRVCPLPKPAIARNTHSGLASCEAGVSN
jgi:hypothetical protein